MPIVNCGDADIHYDVIGDENASPVVLVMGLGLDSRMWAMQTPVLAQHYRVITIDNRGTGLSSVPPPPYTMEHFSSDALAVLDDLGIDKAHIVGVSMGGAISQHLALKAPERIRSLALISTWGHRNAYFDRLNAIGTEVADKIGREGLIRLTLLWLFTPKFFIEQPGIVDVIEQMALGSVAPLEVFRAQKEASLEHDLSNRLHEITAPTLVMVGRRDTFVPPELSERLAAAIPGAELHVLDGGHGFSMAEPESFNRELLDWLAKN